MASFDTTKPFYLWIMTVLSLLQGCSADKDKPMLELLSPERTGIYFSNELYEDENLNIITFEYFYNGAGVGVGDINNDGLSDVFFAANMNENRLYLNKGGFNFEDITKSSGLVAGGKWATGVSLVDINQDGWLDIYVCYSGPFADPSLRANELYINNGNNTFTERASKYGLADTGHSVQAVFFDYDRDGDLDVYMLTNITDEVGPNIIRPKKLHGEMINTDRLYRNNGNLTFTNVSMEAGITIEGYGLGVSVCDINRDGWPDIFVSNDYLSNDILYVNQRNGTFKDKAAEYFSHTSYSAMGNDVADFNNDGLLDLVEVDMLPPDNKRQKLMFGSTNYDRYRSELRYGYTPQFMRNTLQLNVGMDTDGQPVFSEIGQLAGIHATDWSWSPLFADMDNDGRKDLLVTNGYPRDITNRDFASYKAQEFIQAGYNETVRKKLLKAVSSLDGAHLPHFVFQNNGDLTFSDRSRLWGFTNPAYATGAAYADLDNDGDLDYITNNINSPASVYENHATEQNTHRSLEIRFNGPAGNRHGYGTKVGIFHQGALQYHEHSPYRGYQSTVDNVAHFGLGNAQSVDSLCVQWPDGKQQVLKNLPYGVITLSYDSVETSEAACFRNGPKDSGILFNFWNDKSGIRYRHKETEYVDFKIQPLLPHKYSINGPGLALGDVNGDGLEDFFVGGAFKQSGVFFLQQQTGTFTSATLTEETKYEEDMGSLLFDADGDGDNDLYIVSGGNEFERASVYYRDRLYFNDGYGKFTIRPDALPSSVASGSCVTASDYDDDGDLDLFVGGRLTPHGYPQPGQSCILQNSDGRFVDVTENVAPGLGQIGMVTAALWTDVDNDDDMDLMIVGEWMPITIFKNDHGKFTQATGAASVANSTGWWNSLAGGDFDRDGDIDYVVGNLGLNTRHRCQPQKQVGLYVADYNKDGTNDAFLSQYIQDVERPAHPRDDMLQQIVSLKKKYPDYKTYADATMESVIGDTGVKPEVFYANTFASSYLQNNGEKGWRLMPLPLEAQFAPIFGIVVSDYTADGLLDIVLTGNSYAPEVLTGRYDALKGLVLAGNGQGGFAPLQLNVSGLLVDGDAKALAEFTLANGYRMLIASQNDDSLRCFRYTKPMGRIVEPKTSHRYALITDPDGKTWRHEFYYGSGYLSQSTRVLQVSAGILKVEMH